MKRIHTNFMVLHIRRKKKRETQYTHLPSFTSPHQNISFSLPTSPLCLAWRWRLSRLHNGQRGYPDEIGVRATVLFAASPDRERVPADLLEAGGLERHPGHGDGHGHQAVVLDGQADDAPSLLGTGFRQPEARQLEVVHKPNPRDLADGARHAFLGRADHSDVVHDPARANRPPWCKETGHLLHVGVDRPGRLVSVSHYIDGVCHAHLSLGALRQVDHGTGVYPGEGLHPALDFRVEPPVCKEWRRYGRIPSKPTD